MVLYKNVNGERIECSPEEEQKILAEWQKLEDDKQKNAWLDGRKSEYPSIGDQLDMLWHSMDKGEMPGKGYEWYEAIKAVKENYPKPAEVHNGH